MAQHNQGWDRKKEEEEKRGKLLSAEPVENYEQVGPISGCAEANIERISPRCLKAKIIDDVKDSEAQQRVSTLFFFNIYFLFFTIAEDYTLGLRGEQGVAGVNQLFLREKSIVVLDDVSHSPISPIAAS